MSARKVLVTVFWVLMIAAPLVITALVLATLPAGVEQVPMQVGFDGAVNRWGTPLEFWLLGGIAAGCNLLLALCYRFNNALWACGLVHGVKNPQSARIVYMVVAVIMVVTVAVCYWILLGKL